jgi:hypothetical protein
MEQFVIDSIKKNQEEIDDLVKDTTLDKTFKDKLLDILNQEKDMLQQLKKHYEEIDDASGNN